MATEQLVKALYLTLLHSLWQGAAIAGIAGIVMMFGKRSSSASRYNFLAGSMAFFFLCTIATFIIFAGVSSFGTATKIGSASLISFSQNAIFNNPVDNLFSFLNFHSNRIVLLWFLIISLKSLQLYFGLQSIANLKTKQTFDPGTKWAGLVNALSQNLGIHRKVKLFESGLTTIPLTIGYLKPIILVPFGMLAAIPAGQVEAILLHELAHIKRRDYFINIFQSVIEVLFFFNPAIWWLSSLVRAERENCCDDIAIANSSNKINYVRALISFEEYRTAQPSIAIAFTGAENTLLKRTRRIIFNQNNTLNSMEKFILTSGLVVSGLLSLAFSDGAKEQIGKTLKPVVSTISETFPTVEKAFAAFADTIPASSIREISINNGGLTTFNAEHKGKKYKIVMKDDQVTDLYVDNKKIAQEKLSDYTNEIIEIVQFHDAVQLSGTSEKRSSPQGVFTAFEKFDTPKIAVSFRAEHSPEISMTGVGKATTEGKFTAFSTISELASFSAVIDTIPGSPAAPTTPALPAAPPIPTIPATPPTPTLAPRAEGKAIRAIKAKPAKAFKDEVAPAIEILPKPAPKPVIRIIPKVSPAIEIHETSTPEKPKPAAQGGSPMGYSPKLIGSGSISYAPNSGMLKKSNTNDFAYQVKNELVAEGLVKDPKKFSYKISNNELIVDGVRQSEELHNRVISKVLKNKNQNFDFTYKKN